MSKKTLRIISKLECKNQNLIKGINFDGQRVLGLVSDFANLYYQSGIDELIYLDTTASLYKKTVLDKLILKACQNLFIPSSCSGGIKSIGKVRNIFKSGVDKVVLNTQAIKNPKIITKISKVFGTQSVSVGIDIFKQENRIEVWTNYGRENTRIKALDWIKKVQDYGAGEIVVTSINKDGTCKGFDLELLNLIYDEIKVPLIFGGGCGNIEDVIKLIKNFPDLSGIFINSCFHYFYYKKIFKEKNHISNGYSNTNKDIGNTDFAANRENFPKMTNGFSIEKLKRELAINGITVR